MSTNEGKLTKVELKDVLCGDKIATLDLEADGVNLNDSRFTRLELTQGQQIQINGLMNQLPALLNEAALPKTVRLTFPEGVQGSLMPLKRGGYSTTLVDNTGKFVGTASIDFPTFQAAALGAFTVMSIASGQYFLTQINRKLDEISSKLDKILEFLYGDKQAELLSEISFIRFAHENYKSVMEHSEQRIATLISLQSAKKVAMKDIEFYLSDLNSAITRITKKKKETWLVDKMVSIQEFLELSLQLYAMSSLLEVYYSENSDPNYICFVNKDASNYIGRCEKRSLNCFSKLQALLSGTKNLAPIETANKVNAIVERMDEEITSPLLTGLKSALDEASKEKQYYLTRDSEGCKVYMLNAS